MQDGPKTVWSIPYGSVASFFPSLKQNFIAYRSSKMSSRPDWIFEIHQAWQSGFSWVHYNSCCSWLFEPEIIKIGQSSHMILFTNPSARAGYDTRSIFKQSLTGLNSEFSFFWTSCLTKAEEPSLSYYLPIAGGRIIGFIPFPRVLVLCEMQSVSSSIWTRVAVSISYDDNDYITGTSKINDV